MTAQERLCEHVMRTAGRTLTQTEIQRPWTYVHRQWIDGDGERCCEVTAVVIERDDGTLLRFNVP